MERQQVRVLRIVVASPGDVQAERKALPDVIDEINRGVAADRNLRLELSLWETDTYPGFHAKGPQGEIDTILRIDDCDLLIGIFWHQFGTPTMDAASGTEHEFRLAYQAWLRSRRPQIMVYFNDKAYSPRSKEETDQWGRVLEFKSNFPKEGLWWPYRGSSHLASLARNHVTQYVRHLDDLNKASSEVSTLYSPRINKNALAKAFETGKLALEVREYPSFNHDVALVEGRYRIRLFFEFDDDVPGVANTPHRAQFSRENIEAVHYLLHETFKERIITSTSRKKGFEVWFTIDAEFTVIAVIEHKDGPTIAMTRYLNFPV